MVVVAQLVRAADCGSAGRGFEPPLSPSLFINDFLGRTLLKAYRHSPERLGILKKRPRNRPQPLLQVGLRSICVLPVAINPTKRIIPYYSFPGSAWERTSVEAPAS